MPFVPGFDLAREVLARGPAVTAFEVGDRVAALLAHRGGGLAERVLVRQSRAARIPDTLGALAAAAVPLAGLTALQALHGLGRIAAARGPRSGLRVLLIGAAGGVGSFAVQLAVLAGADVTATTSAGKVEWVRELGAANVVDRRRVDVAALAEASGPFDVVLDAAGRSGRRDLSPSLTARGRVVSARPPHPDTLRALGRRDFAAVRAAARSQDLAHLLHLVATGRLRSPVEHVLGLDTEGPTAPTSSNNLKFSWNRRQASRIATSTTFVIDSPTARAARASTYLMRAPSTDKSVGAWNSCAPSTASTSSACAATETDPLVLS